LGSSLSTRIGVACGLRAMFRVLLVAGLGLAGAARADAVGWRLVGSSGDGALKGVSCTSPSACTAVGWEGTGPGGRVLSERWNGVEWLVQPIAAPTGGQSLWTDVSCGSPRFCVAIGMVVYSPNFSGFFRSIRGIWNGSRWSIQLLPKHTTDIAVSCASRRFCVMTGTPTEQWNGSRWSAMPTAGHVADLLGAISCTSAKSCLAIAGTTSERWNGKTWSVMGQLKDDVGPQGIAGFSAVSCASRRLCVAVGSQSVGGDANSTPLVDRWDGARWLVQPVAAPYGVGVAGVGCTALLKCTIVGENTPYVVGPPVSSTFAEGWNGTSWSVEPTPNPQVGQPSAFGQPDTLTEVSCVASTCIAVGFASNASGQAQTLIEQYP
jgi:hypothetical protein